MLKQLLNDEAGFIVSAELVLIATLVVIGLIVGLVEVRDAVANELNDVAEAIGSLNQSFIVSGLAGFKQDGSIKAQVFGSQFQDFEDDCDGNECDLDCDQPIPGEAPKPAGP